MVAEIQRSHEAGGAVGDRCGAKLMEVCLRRRQDVRQGGEFSAGVGEELGRLW